MRSERPTSVVVGALSHDALQLLQLSLLRRTQTVAAEDCSRGGIIGHGGPRGSVVFRAEFAFKQVEELNVSELLFVAASQGKRFKCIVTPLLVSVSPAGIPNGVVMPIMTASLQELLASQLPSSCLNSSGAAVTDDGCQAGAAAFVPAATPNSLFRQETTFAPVESLRLIGCVALQVLTGLVELKHSLPHELQGVSFSGFSHNDVRLDNVLVDAETGRVKLCDFEQVEHYEAETGATHRGSLRGRSLSRAYVPGAAGGGGKSDEWTFGLMILEMFTGIQPLFDSEAMCDDFSYDADALRLGFDWSEALELDPVNFPSIHSVVNNCIRPLPAPRLISGASEENGDSAESALDQLLSDFLARCLCRDATQRADVSELLCHPFVVTASSGGSLEQAQRIVLAWVRSVRECNGKRRFGSTHTPGVSTTT